MTANNYDITIIMSRFPLLLLCVVILCFPSIAVSDGGYLELKSRADMLAKKMSIR